MSEQVRGTNPVVLVLCSGSVACVKVAELCESLKRRDYTVLVAATRAAQHFLQPSTHDDSFLPHDATAHASINREWFRHSVAGCPLFVDDDEWRVWSKVGDAVLHIELRKAADVAVLAPLDANTLAKLSHGLADNLVTSVMRAWDVKGKPVIVAPAMNTLMWEHPLTAQQLATLGTFYSRFALVPPVEKVLACGDTGVGALAPLASIVAAVDAAVM